MDSGDSFRRSKAKSDPLLSPEAEVKNTWSNTSTPPQAFMSCYLILYRDKVVRLGKFTWIEECDSKLKTGFRWLRIEFNVAFV
jgi:hypothetical protein